MSKQDFIEHLTLRHFELWKELPSHDLIHNFSEAYSYISAQANKGLEE